MAMPPTAAVQYLGEDEAASLTIGPNNPDAVGNSAEASADSLPADDLFYLLKNARRRAVIRYLHGREGPVRMREVAEQVAAWEHDTTVAQLTSDERKRVYVALYQSHLEILAHASVIVYNKPRGVIEPQPLLDDVASYLDRVGAEPTGTTGAEDPWPERYLEVTVISTLLLVGTALDLPVVERLSGFAVCVLILLLFTGLTVANLVLVCVERA